ncbi:hypothetical protein, partial [Photobacterium damselae]|uniref:hypothetical protein n=1 Tax=Photobacterium damselae TaxID=38293 RepID=UPI001A8D44D3
GIAAKFVTPPNSFVDKNTGEIVTLGALSKHDSINAARKIRYELQDVSAKILKRYYGNNPPINKNGYAKDHATCTCNRFR